MDSVLIVSATEKSIAFITEFLSRDSYKEIVTVKNCGEAKRLLVERDFDLCIVNTPLTDEFGEGFALNTASRELCQVILIVKCELFDEVSSRVEDYGVYTIAKPMNRQVFWSALKMAGAAYNKIERLKRENWKLMRKIEDIRYIDRAKCVLIQYLNMSESEAHRYIEKQAMDMRMTRKQVADDILKTYES